MCHVCHRSFLEYSFSNWNGQRLRRFRILIAEFIFNYYCQNLALQSQLVSTLMCCSRPPSPSPVPRAFPLPISKGKDLGTRLPPPPHTHTPSPMGSLPTVYHRTFHQFWQSPASSIKYHPTHSPDRQLPKLCTLLFRVKNTLWHGFSIRNSPLLTYLWVIFLLYTRYYDCLKAIVSFCRWNSNCRAKLQPYILMLLAKKGVIYMRK